MRIGVLCRLDDLGVGGAIFAEPDILLDCRAEQHRLLIDDRQMSSQPRQLKFLHVRVVDVHRTLDRVVETLQQLHARRLAAAGRADERHRLAGFDLEVDAVEERDIGPRRIVEWHGAKLDVTIELDGPRALVRQRVDFGHSIDDGEYFVAGRLGRGYLGGKDLERWADLEEADDEVGQDEKDATHRERWLARCRIDLLSERPAVEKAGRVGAEDHEVDDADEAAAEEALLDAELFGAVEFARVAMHLFLVAVEGEHRANSREDFLGNRASLSVRGQLVLRKVAQHLYICAKLRLSFKTMFA